MCTIKEYVEIREKMIEITLDYKHNRKSIATLMAENDCPEEIIISILMDMNAKVRI
jgi:hypothetical protein